MSSLGAPLGAGTQHRGWRLQEITQEMCCHIERKVWKGARAADIDEKVTDTPRPGSGGAEGIAGGAAADGTKEHQYER